MEEKLLLDSLATERRWTRDDGEDEERERERERENTTLFFFLLDLRLVGDQQQELFFSTPTG